MHIFYCDNISYLTNNSYTPAPAGPAQNAKWNGREVSSLIDYGYNSIIFRYRTNSHSM